MDSSEQRLDGAVPATSGRPRTAIIVAAGCSGLVVLVVILLVAVLVVRAIGGGPSESSKAPLSQQATDLATAHMDALVAGDAETVLADVVPGESLMLEDAAYSAAIAEGVISDVDISEPVVDESALAEADVDVTYSIDGQATSGTLSMHDYDDDGTLELTAGMYTYSHIPDSYSGLSVTVNGSAVEPGGSYIVIPGVYTLEHDSEYLDLEAEGADESSGEGAEIVADPMASVEFPRPVLNDAGQEAARERVIAAVDDCLKETSLAAGCGMDPVPATSSDGWTSVEGTVKRELSETTRRDLERMTFESDTDEATLVTGNSIGAPKTTFDCQIDGRTQSCELFLGGSLGFPTVDLADPEAPVLWD